MTRTKGVRRHFVTGNSAVKKRHFRSQDQSWGGVPSKSAEHRPIGIYFPRSMQIQVDVLCWDYIINEGLMSLPVGLRMRYCPAGLNELLLAPRCGLMYVRKVHWDN